MRSHALTSAHFPHVRGDSVRSARARDDSRAINRLFPLVFGKLLKWTRLSARSCPSRSRKQQGSVRGAEIDTARARELSVLNLARAASALYCSRAQSAVNPLSLSDRSGLTANTRRFTSSSRRFAFFWRTLHDENHRMRVGTAVMPVRSADRSHALVLALIVTASLTSSRGQDWQNCSSCHYLAGIRVVAPNGQRRVEDWDRDSKQPSDLLRSQH
ncbi:seizure protein 6 homolog isoform X1 [Tachysurus ichikawai]